MIQPEPQMDRSEVIQGAIVIHVFWLGVNIDDAGISQADRLWAMLKKNGN